jgi:ABC-type nickel/cobalt efflux system permease component RcnA
LRRDHALVIQGPASTEGALPYFAGLSPCPLTTIIMVVALANGMVTLGLLVSLSMALGMTVTVTLLALAVILSRRWLLEFFARHAARVDRVARVLEIAGAAATLVGLLLLSAELA